VAAAGERAALEPLAGRAVVDRWLDGGDADWRALWPEGTPRRLALDAPYPFERRSYWFESNERRETCPTPR
jgi:hypothetical protein